MTSRKNPENKTLQPRHKQFCIEYLKDFHGADAAIRAGFNSNRPWATSYYLLNRSDVKAYLHEAIGYDSEKTPRKIFAESKNPEKQKFSADVKAYIKAKNAGVMEAVIDVAYFNQIDMTEAGARVDLELRDMIEAEAKNLRLLKQEEA